MKSIPVGDGEDVFLIIVIGVRVLWVVDDQGSPKTVGILSTFVRVP